MRYLRGLLVSVSAGALTLGLVGVSQALGSSAETVASVRGGEDHGKGGDHVVVDKSKHNLHHSCQGGTFGYCTQNANFSPKILGDVSLIGTTGLIGVTGTTGTDGTTGTTGRTGTDGTTAPPGDAEWCSPGYWKNHPAAWGPTGVSPDTLYSSVFGAPPPRSPNGVRNNAPTDPSLFVVVSNPQWYGGGAANNVADYLSDHHPDINYQGVRVDNCPL
ncbi:hypothetical protein [Streptomyces globisporus]|uniref:hypothetical protein n=1 Tax=Streptomyces globisporus TaxID=1908 RepID=UPI0004CABC2B|nr:hypothetical protein [Streptomyces globisporus]